MTLVKICGIRDIDTALAAAQAGADYLGLVFAPSRRQILPVKAMEIIRAVRELPVSPLITGIFVNSPASDVNYIAENCKLDVVQLSGDENWDYCREIKFPLIKAIHITPSSTVTSVIEVIKKGYGFLGSNKLVFLLDTHSKTAYGGTGLSFNPQIAQGVAAAYQVFIGGGLTPENVSELIRLAKPRGVDVSSGVETEGVKDIRKIKYFIQTVRGIQLTNK
jgi:phosphoribosylanthranilate isomerase